MVFKSFMLFSYLLHCVFEICSKIGFKTWLFQGLALFLRFLHLITKKIIINCEMMNKMVQDERIHPAKHNHIIHGKFDNSFSYQKDTA